MSRSRRFSKLDFWQNSWSSCESIRELRAEQELKHFRAQLHFWSHQQKKARDLEHAYAAHTERKRAVAAEVAMWLEDREEDLKEQKKLDSMYLDSMYEDLCDDMEWHQERECDFDREEPLESDYDEFDYGYDGRMREEDHEFFDLDKEDGFALGERMRFARMI